MCRLAGRQGRPAEVRSLQVKAGMGVHYLPAAQTVGAVRARRLLWLLPPDRGAQAGRRGSATCFSPPPVPRRFCVPAESLSCSQ